MIGGGTASITSFDEASLGKAIGDARRLAGLTQQQLCEKLDISYSALTKIERGAIKSPSVFTVAQIAQICSTSIESLLGIGPISTIARKLIIPNYSVAKNGIKFVYFDINGCMVRFFQRAFTEVAHDTGANPELIENTFWHYNDAVCRGEMPMSEFDDTLAARLGIKKISWLDYYLRNIDVIPEMHACAAWAAKGFPIGLLSNIMPGFIEAMMTEQLLPNLPYTCIIDSSVVGAIKPEQKIYEIATAHSGMNPSEILLVDDSRTNLMAAERMGWHVLWFDDFRPTESVDRIKSTLEI
jgi:FMN phosphatase YigB (HAD superfamily)/DNA-binding XRE family transcriptional regulator